MKAKAQDNSSLVNMAQALIAAVLADAQQGAGVRAEATPKMIQDVVNALAKMPIKVVAKLTTADLEEIASGEQGAVQAKYQGFKGYAVLSAVLNGIYEGRAPQGMSGEQMLFILLDECHNTCVISKVPEMMPNPTYKQLVRIKCCLEEMSASAPGGCLTEADIRCLSQGAEDPRSNPYHTYFGFEELAEVVAEIW